MQLEPVAILFFLVSLVLLWTHVFRLNGSTLLDEILAPLYQLIAQKSPLNIEPVSFPSPWSKLDVDLLTCICQFYGPVRFNSSDRKKAVKVLIVLSALSRLFNDLKYVGKIDLDEVFAYHLLLSELSFV